MGCGGSSAAAQQPQPQVGDQLSKKKILPGQSAIIRNCPNARLNGQWVVCEEYNDLGEWTVKGDKFPLSLGMSLAEQYLEVEGSQLLAPKIVPGQSVVICNSPNVNKPAVTHTADMQQFTRMIKIHFASGEAVELAVSAGDTVGDLCRRTADLRGAGWATLLVGSEAFDEKLDACSIPEVDVITAVLSNSMERPDRLKKTLREQIQKSCEINLHGDENLEEAFKQTSWRSFREFCQPVQDFHLTLFECADEKIIEINYGLGDNDYGTLHREGVVDPIMVNCDGDWEPQVEAWKDVHDAFCDKCNKTIIGTRHKSLELDDYDLCESCFKSEDRKAEAWEQPEPPPQLSVAERREEEEEDEDEDAEGQYDSDDERYEHIEPFFLAILKARKANCIEKHGV
jgi:hypothetical protein